MNPIKKKSIGKQLKNALTGIHVDIFGYEKQIHQNINSYFKRLSQKTGIPINRIVVRIFKDQGRVRSAIYQQGSCIYQVSLQELIELFTGMPSMIIESEVEKTIKTIIQDFSNTHQIDSETLQLCIFVYEQKAYIKGVSNTKVIGEILAKTLIPYFL